MANGAWKNEGQSWLFKVHQLGLLGFLNLVRLPIRLMLRFVCIYENIRKLNSRQIEKVNIFINIFI